VTLVRSSPSPLEVAVLAALLLAECSEGDVLPERRASLSCCYEIPYVLTGVAEAHPTDRVNHLPFPYDFFTAPDPRTLTGRRLALVSPAGATAQIVNSTIVDRGLAALIPDTYTQALNTLDGFSTSGQILLEVGPNPAMIVFPRDPAATARPESPILLVNVDPTSSDFGRPVAYKATAHEAADLDSTAPDGKRHLYWYLTLKPLQPLLPGSRYAVVVTRALLSEEGRVPVSSTHFQEVWGEAELCAATPGVGLRAIERQRLAYLKDLLAGLGIIPLDQVVLAWDFTTQTSTRDLEYLATTFLAQIRPAPPDLDFDGDGERNVIGPLEAYPSHLPPRPPVDLAQVSLTVVGQLETPEFRQLTDPRHEGEVYYCAFERDPEQRPKQNGTFRSTFFLFYPKEAVQPMPVVILQHGIGSRKEDMASLVGHLTARGIAAIAFDFPWHGARARGLPPLEFIDVAHPLKTASSFKQAAFESLFLAKALVSGAFDIWPGKEGDGVPDFDPGRVGLLGHSLGAIVGATSVALSQDLHVAVLNVGGAGLDTFLEGLLEGYGLTGLFPEYWLQQFGTIAQTLLDSGDGWNFTPRLRARLEAKEVQVLLQQAMEDETIPALFSMNLSRILGAWQIEPVQTPIYGCSPAPSPFFGPVAVFQFAGASHGFLFSSEAPGPQGRTQTFEFFDSFMRSSPHRGIVVNPFLSWRAASVFAGDRQSPSRGRSAVPSLHR
jgi:dienelactone hydrolase